MKELQEILFKIEQLEPEEKAILATVVDVKGSGYRLPGARMLIAANGDTFGTVSGGCLEADVLERAKRIAKSGKAEVFTYDTTVDENSVFSLNMGCRGVMRILLEPVGQDSEIVSMLRTAREERRETTVATLIAADDGSNLQVGERVRSNESKGSIFDAIPALRDDLATFSGSRSQYETLIYEVPEGEVEFAFESIVPPMQLLIFGAGADAVPLAETAHDLGWTVRVCDHRPAFLTDERFPKADELIRTTRDERPTNIVTDKLTAIVSMNHNYDRDREGISVALASDAFYIGALGPKKRTQQLLGELAAGGETFNDEQLARLRSPAGLDIGADTPEAIAVAIAAEIQSVFKNRNGGPLRDRHGSIYDRK